MCTDGNVKCKLCQKTFREEVLPDHFEDDHEEEYDTFKEGRHFSLS